MTHTPSSGNTLAETMIEQGILEVAVITADHRMPRIHLYVVGRFFRSLHYDGVSWNCEESGHRYEYAMDAVNAEVDGIQE